MRRIMVDLITFEEFDVDTCQDPAELVARHWTRRKRPEELSFRTDLAGVCTAFDEDGRRVAMVGPNPAGWRK